MLIRQAANPSAPAEEGMAAAGGPVHWVDLDSPYHALPESWKQQNRKYAKAADEETNAEIMRISQVLEMSHVSSHEHARMNGNNI